MRTIEIIVIAFGWAALIGCIVAGADTSGRSNSPELSQKYYDGCYYLVTPAGGITAKVNQPLSCKE